MCFALNSFNGLLLCQIDFPEMNCKTLGFQTATLVLQLPKSRALRLAKEN